jgi:hypothetical protein
MVEYLIKDSKPDENGDSKKYKLANIKDKAKYKKSRKNKDVWGNNPFHYIWDIDIEEMRKKMLEILLVEDVGCALKPNKMGMLPHFVDHRFSYQKDIPDHLKYYFKDIERFGIEGDYQIVTS